jgi:preprotein translocase subunit SecD
MRRRVVPGGVLALVLAAAYSLPAPAHAFKDETVYRVEAWDDGAAPGADTIKAVAEVLRRRFAHPGFPKGAPIVQVEEDRIRIARSPDGADERALYDALTLRRGTIEFRIRAKTAVEDEWRDRRLLAGTAPPPGLIWCEPVEGPSKVLVEAPEQAAAAKLDAAKKKDPADPAAVKSAQDEVERALRESVFGNADVAKSSVERKMRSWGAQRFLHVAVRFELREERRNAFEEFTGWRVGRDFCVVVDGKVKFCAPIPAAMPGSGEIRGPGTGWTDDEARELAACMETGPLPCRLVPVEPK